MANYLQHEANEAFNHSEAQNVAQPNVPKNSIVDDQKEKRSQSFGQCCKKVTKFLASHIGLVVMVILYAIAGAFLFELLEQHQEAKDCQEGQGQEAANIVNLKSQLLTYIQYNITSSSLDTTKDNETVANVKIEDWLSDFRDDVISLKSSYRYTGQNCKTELKWTFAGALLFAITVITTIGYGNIAPCTWEGQIVCICYATIGIPLFLMCIANISGVLGDMFRYVYAKVCCRICLRKQKPTPTQPPVNNDSNLQPGSNGELIHNAKGQEETGFSDKKPDSATSGARGVDDAGNADPIVIEEEEEEEDEERVTVPLTITMIIITFYVFIGAALFNFFEGWSLIQAGYFCYITLATIGFGDFVPGQNTSDSLAGVKLLLGAVYALFGMAILAMCFDLMQEEIIAKFTWLGKKVGILKKEEDELAEEEQLEQEKREKEFEKQKEKEKMEAAKNGEGKTVTSEKQGFDFNHDRFNSPAPSYSETNTTEEERMARIRYAYFKNLHKN